MNSRLFTRRALLTLLLIGLGQNLRAADPTAFVLAHEGDNSIPAEAKDRVTAIHSTRSSGSLVPNVWHIDYYDPTTFFKHTDVAFVDGKVAKVSRPKRVLDLVRGARQLSWKPLKIDSNNALSIAVKDPRLANLDLRSAQYWLNRAPDGGIWKIRFWAAKPGEPGELTRVGDIYISCRDGSVVKSKLREINN